MQSDSRPPLRPAIKRLVFAAIALSSAAGLIHAAVWWRFLRLVMGNTPHAAAIVLGLVLAGVALGSIAGGRLIDRRQDPLRIFAILQALLGASCLLLPWLIQATTPLFRAAYGSWGDSPTLMTAVSIAVTTGLFLAPAAMAGTALPILARWMTPVLDQTARFAGRLYGYSMLGAALGAAAAGTWLVPAFGVWGAIAVGVALNVLVGAVACAIHFSAVTASAKPRAAISTTRHVKRRHRKSKVPPFIATRPVAYALLAGCAVSGMAALIYLQAWTRTLTLLIGSSVHAFALILTAFLLGLGAGSIAFAKRAQKIRDPLRALAAAQLGVGLFGLLGVPLLGALPYNVTGLIARLEGSFWRLQAAEFALILVVTLAPTLLMGAAFPLFAHLLATASRGVGRLIGGLYGGSMLGAIAGALVGSFLLIPAIGAQHTIFVAAGTSLALGCVYLLVNSRTRLRVRIAGAATALAAATGLMAVILPWDARTMTFGPVVHAVSLPPAEALSQHTLRNRVAAKEIVFYDEGVGETVAVSRTTRGVMTLHTNGQVDAIAPGGSSQQLLLAHIPLLLHPDAHDVLVIGLAGGVTLDAVARRPLHAIDCVELSPGVVEATRMFRKFNHDVLDDPRLRLIIGDGRQHVALTDRRYDVIVSQPSDPIATGTTDRLTREFFADCVERLNERGLLCVWVKSSCVGTDAFRSVVRTFAESVDDVTIWSSPEFTDYMLMGSRGPMAIDYRLLAERLNDARFAANLKRLRIASTPDLLANLVTCRAGAIQFAQDADPLTDHEAQLEFLAPRTYVSRANPQPLVEALLSSRDASLAILKQDADSSGSTTPSLDEVKDETNRHFDSRVHVYKALAAYERGDEPAALPHLISAARLNPRDTGLQVAIAQLRRTTRALIEAEQVDEAIRIIEQILQVSPDSAADRFALACLRRDAGDSEESLVQFERVIRIDPDHARAHFCIAELAYEGGRTADAVAYYREAVRIDPNMTPALRKLAWLLATEHNPELGAATEAVEFAERACELTHRQDAATLDALAGAYEAAGQVENALRTAQAALALARVSSQIDLVNVLDKRIALYKQLLAEQ